MSIIHEALKKVQQGLSVKPGEEQVETLTTSQNTTAAYIYETPPVVETLPQQTVNQRPPMQNKIKSIFALACALLITVASILYIWQQFQNNIPRVQTFAKKTFYKMIHKPVPAKTAPEGFGPLAQLTINPAAAKAANLAKPAPITLDIHGIMANTNGNLVLINDQVYQEGDEVDGAKIVKIDLDSIKIINNGVEQTIFVKN